ncbi:helix-turn-helix domain-containing protein [Micromonospora sp. RTGN7]|uniref:helix-turn-helix domain-containing protein n=1 Tax=Micromonospora sp. RTGN7 TaxID=3016526 RepID=UPI0029FF4F9A|nr:helix-turn-helix domain-containing protein [Micromonospora sp. RTGN7]
MSSPRPVTQADHDQVRALHAQGLGRNAIAKELRRSGKTISNIAAEMGLSFERTGAAAAATEARKADGATRRAQLQLDALNAANRLMGQMFQPALVYNFGGKENDYNSTTLDEPPFADKRNIATAIQALAGTALKLAEYDKATGNESEKSMLTDLRQALIDARKSGTP